MAGGGQAGRGGRSGGGASGQPSWNGGAVQKQFDPKDFGSQIFGDAQRIYQQGPQVNPISSFTDYSKQTKGLIDQGLQNNQDLRNGNIGDIARGGVNIGPDYTTGIMGDVAAGRYLGNGNPYLNDAIRQTQENVSNDVNSTFASNGRFGADIHAQGLGQGLANAENTARFNQYNTDYGNMTQALGLQGQQANNNLDWQTRARGMLDNGTAQALGYSGMLDSKAQQRNDARRQMWDSQHNAGYNHIAQYLGLLNGNGDATNKPLSIWDILGGVGSAVSTFV